MMSQEADMDNLSWCSREVYVSQRTQASKAVDTVASDSLYMTLPTTPEADHLAASPGRTSTGQIGQAEQLTALKTSSSNHFSELLQSSQLGSSMISARVFSSKLTAKSPDEYNSSSTSKAQKQKKWSSKTGATIKKTRLFPTKLEDDEFVIRVGMDIKDVDERYEKIKVDGQTVLYRKDRKFGVSSEAVKSVSPENLPRAIRLHWLAPDDPNGLILHYWIRYRRVSSRYLEGFWPSASGLNTSIDEVN
ncbi:unnamed protein product [Protopolystoma xenopodis]|uniref:Fibronectin type-III domain-containing protein n=1 Tax=Protopolystoma xenopodis TaxID=117903 RepID=A0A448WL91_9PLAT|nr:unnamed protein product [Protopolystoma xenopodis]